jgi:hypothetical protein
MACCTSSHLPSPLSNPRHKGVVLPGLSNNECHGVMEVTGSSSDPRASIPDHFFFVALSERLGKQRNHDVEKKKKATNILKTLASTV